MERFLIGQNLHQPFLKRRGMPIDFLVLTTEKDWGKKSFALLN